MINHPTLRPVLLNTPDDEPVAGPAGVAGVQFWFKADVGTFQSSGGPAATQDGDVVGEWQDQSGNDWHAAQATTSKKPTLRTNVKNSLPVVRFDGSNDVLDFTPDAFTSPYTAFAVIKLDSAAVQGDAHYFAIHSKPSLFRRWSAPKVWAIAGGATLPDGDPDANWHIWTARFDGSSSYLRHDGAEIVSGDAGSADSGTDLALGNSNAEGWPWDGDIGEILFYHPALDADDVDLIEDYLSDRWGITLS